MQELLKNGYKAKKRPSGHDISNKFGRDNKASISPNFIAVANTESNSGYLRYCKEHGLEPNPARYPSAVPEYFIRMLTNPGDLVLDPFAGSCVTGEVSERLKRRWICVEIVEEYLQGALSRFQSRPGKPETSERTRTDFYKIPKPGGLWNGYKDEPLPEDGGLHRPVFETH